MRVLEKRATMSSAAKAWLSNTVRALRERLLKDLSDAVESTYRMALPLATAGLNEERSHRRQRLEHWLLEQVRSGGRATKETEAQARERHLKSALKLAAATFLNRLVVLRQMEALGLTRVKVVTGAWNSPGYAEFREFAPALLAGESEGYDTLLRLTFEELALDMPGLFGDVGVTSLFPIPSATLRATVEVLADGPADGPADSKLGPSQGEVADLWQDDTLLGWVYQFWNDPEREALDEKIRNRGKIENHEIAAKTQLFTDRYMVEWLLQNSLGQLWFAICQTNDWTPEIVADGTLDELDKRRAEWRGKRERGEVDLEALMPLESEAEEHWKYWVPQKLPADAAEHALTSLKDARVLDPACGSGHFLVIAFDLLAALYKEEARHRGKSWTAEQIACWIVENNLHGIDIDPRAVQIAAAALWLKLKVYAPKAQPKRMNLVASNLGLGSLPKDDPALLELESAVERETGIPAALTGRIVESLKGADYLGSLLKVGDTIDDAIAEHEKQVGLTANAPSQGDLFEGFAPNPFAISADEAKTTLLGRLGVFLSHHTGSADLGLRLRGEQLAAGVRFIRMLREGQYDLVVLNPPYQSRGKLANTKAYEALYHDGRADFFAGFMIRALELTKARGLAASVTLSNWRFLSVFEKLRSTLLGAADLVLLGDMGKAAFSSGSMLISTSCNLFQKGRTEQKKSLAVRPYHPDDVIVDPRQVVRNTAALQAGYHRHEFHPDKLSVVPGHPLIYWWDEEFLREYASAATIADLYEIRVGLQTSSNVRFLRAPWEVASGRISLAKPGQAYDRTAKWLPYIKGAAGKVWFEPVSDCVDWKLKGLEIKTFERDGRQASRPQNEDYYFRPGIAFSMIGAEFSARAHRYRSVFGNKGSSVFPDDIAGTLCLMNSKLARHVLESLNPGIGFEVGDVNRLPLFPIESAHAIVAQLEAAFTEHERAREASVEFQKPGPSAWTYAQDWAQRAVDRPKGEPLPPYEPVYEPETPLDYLSFALGVAMGRFHAAGAGLASSAHEKPPTTPQKPNLPCAAPAPPSPNLLCAAPGLLYLSASGGPDSLEHPAAQPLHRAWETHGAKLSKKSLRDYLRESFFKDDHLKRYEKRPIYFPLTSSKKSFVAWCAIHTWTNDTLPTLLADFLHPEFKRLSGELADLGSARLLGDRASQAKAQSRFDEVQELHQELQEFISQVSQIAERGAPPADGKCPPREVDAKFEMDLDDGVMITSAALWPLLEPVWKDPKKWWSELCTASTKDYDWAHLAARYFPTRVDAKCKIDPSLAVAHGCFWKYHPEKAYQWELRLQSPDELGPTFKLDETDSDALREQFERNQPETVRELCQLEEKRRERKAGKTASDEEESGQLELEEDEE